MVIQPAGETVRLRDFEAALNSRFGTYSLEAEPSARVVSGSISDMPCGPLTLSRVDVAGIISSRPPLSSRWENRVFLMMPRQGQIVVRQYGRMSSLASSDLLLLDSRAGCSIAAASASTNLFVELERGLFAQLPVPIEELCGQRVPGQRGMGRLLAAFVSSVADDLGEFSRHDGTTLQNVIVDLFRCAISPEIESDAGHAVLPMIRRMREWLVTRVEDPSLSPDRIAAEFGLSRRSLYRIFVAIGTTPGKWIWQTRLDCARHRLTAHAFIACSISEIAYSVGFNDSSHFARLFRRQFGMTPQELRRHSAR